jgi:tetratricopeptide (TPR) repeat protein
MKLSTEACVAFERDINLFVDHELPVAENGHLVDHLQACGACRDYVDDLRELSELHRATASAEVSEAEARGLAEVVDRHALFASITRTLVGDKRSELARLFYELGKAYVLLANHSREGRPQRSVMAVAAPVDIRSASDRGRRVAQEGEDLSAASAEPDSESGSLFRRSRRLFQSASRAGAGALVTGRRLLEQALVMRPDFDEARLYLGFHHMLAGRNDRARVEFRRVYREGRDLVHRMMALQFLGNVHASAGDYGRAIECFEEVVSSGVDTHEPRLFTSLHNLAVVCAKAGHPTRSVRHFTEFVARFPARIDQARVLLSRKETFAAVLRREADLHEQLRRQVPALFAA